ncbi:extracellular dioxygenase-like protein [Aulographum hederae CBS 113979]|uniref:Extracellular dioxygenase-like protein n=1 Tax=Aulographum hederae CBS 113979 TaxID=1176131 RepID=A0A6G1HGG2_9PEZI|nr:extracellular dioxygenase-like protein [Aulographum hederae CBS 113979]
MKTLERTSLAGCAKELEANGHAERMMQRRQATLEKARMDRGLSGKHHLKIRQVADSPHSSSENYDMETPNWVLFGDNQTTVLSPEVTEGPFWVSGELVRNDIREGQAGVDLHLDIQVMDMNTCKPVPNAAIDFWHANATGVYGGVISTTNAGNPNDMTNLQNHAFRGIQMTDEDGVVEFFSKMPGHYEGRAVHIHVMSTLNATQNANSTISGGKVAHVGQLYFDMPLNEAVKLVEPYASNNMTFTQNGEDNLFAEGGATGADPVVEYTLLGDKIEDGVFAWINFGVDAGYVRNVSAAATCGEGGCVMNPSSGKGKGKGKGKGPDGMMPPPPKRQLWV